MNILAFDTCLDKMCLALSLNGAVVDSKLVETTDTHYHSAFLISSISEILKQNNLSPKSIDAIATNIGPGSFTGIRACTTVARIFAQALNIKTIGISSLEILSRGTNTSKPVLVALDARKEMAYTAIFENNICIDSPKAVMLDKLKEVLERNDYFVLTDNALLPVIGGISYQNQNYNLGASLINIACERLKTDCNTDWRKLQPLYIQPPALHCKVTC